MILTTIGATSGWKQAKVVNPSVDNLIGTKPNVLILGQVKIVSTSSTNPAGCQGDSGSAWYQPTSTTTAAFYGIHSSSTNDATANNLICGSSAFFSPTQQINSGFSSLVVTYTRP